MAPFPFCYLLAGCNNTAHRTLLPRLPQSDAQLKAQWQSPSDILSLLLILGPEVVQHALAQASGARYVPVAFSFGWVAYSFTALLAVASGRNTLSNFNRCLLTEEDGHMMPEADFQSLIINAKTGHQRENRAWIVGRLLRDFEKRAVPFASDKASPDWEALRVSVFQWDERKAQGIPDRDWIWYSGLAVVVLQISIGIIPLALSSEWATLVLVTAGILLATAQAALPQWRNEKWACPTNNQTISITQGNGHRHLLVLLGSPKGLDLEILAAGSSTKEQTFLNKAAIAILTACWTGLLITVAGLKQGSWCKISLLSPESLDVLICCLTLRALSAIYCLKYKY